MNSSLLNWCKEHSVELDSRLLLLTDRVLSNDYILKSTPIAKVPKDALLTIRSSSMHQQLSQLNQSRVVLLSFALAFEIHRGERSTWLSYIESLPKEAPEIASLWLPTPEMDGMELAKELHSLCNTKEGIRGRHSRAQLEDIFHTSLAPLADGISFNDYLYAYAITSSRLFTIDNYHDVGLVPVADLFNHTEESTVEFESDTLVCGCCGNLSHSQTNDKQTVDIVTIETIEPHQELFNSYGDTLSNVQLAMDYGFTLDANEFDRVRFDGDAIDFQWEFNDNDQELFVNDCNLYIDSEARVSLGLFGVTDIAIIDHIVMAYEQSSKVAEKPLREYIQCLIDKIDARLKEYPMHVNITNAMLVQMRQDEIGLLETSKRRFKDLL
ncbi:SET domain-containing protein [Wallemia mellicola]|uniref:SET domain-containing protein n=1 Tax=Wallemia mellicola TaxID=1708541 RepID=A0A4T0LY21_9BASI|nr:SET domain-containing protein [Wallemia mellicola]